MPKNGKSSRNNIYITLIITECECFTLNNPGIINKRLKFKDTGGCPKCGHGTFMIPLMVQKIPEQITRKMLNRMSMTNKLKLLNQKELRVLVTDDWWQRYQILCLPKKERYKQLKERHKTNE